MTCQNFHFNLGQDISLQIIYSTSLLNFVNIKSQKSSWFLEYIRLEGTKFGLVTSHVSP
jgi:hypothetical protein